MAKAQVINTVLDLRRRGNRLLKLAEQLIDEYDIRPEDLGDKPFPSPAPASEPTEQASTNGSHTRAERGDRLRQLREFFEAEGRFRRKDIPERTGIPTGTVNHLLKRPEFDQDDSGLWGLAEDENAPGGDSRDGD